MIQTYDHDLPDIHTLVQLLEKHGKLIVQYTSLPPGYIEQLTDSLEHYAVAHVDWNNQIYILPAMATGKILSRKQDIYDCARSFGKDATELMQQMAVTFGINLETLEGWEELKHVKSERQRGALDEHWDYFLHGAECRFEHNKTGQVVEAIIITHPEFGCLDAYFLYNYMSTTERFKELAAWFDNKYTNVGKAMDILVQEGTLTRYEGKGLRRDIIAR